MCNPNPKHTEVKIIIMVVNFMLSRSGLLYSVKNINKVKNTKPNTIIIQPHASIGSKFIKKFLMVVPNFSSVFWYNIIIYKKCLKFKKFLEQKMKMKKKKMLIIESEHLKRHKHFSYTLVKVHHQEQLLLGQIQ